MKAVHWIAPLLALLAACSGQSSVEQTLVAENGLLATDIADIRATATVAADRLMITQEYVQTAQARSALQFQILSATLAALGGDALAVRPQPATPAAPPAVEALTPAPPAGGIQAAVTPTPAAGGEPLLYNVVMAKGVGANDCALAAVTSFSTTDTAIYVVATAANIAPGTRLASRWFREGTEVILHDFTPNFAINQSCVWFFIDSTETTFSPGSWSVQLEINGIPAGPPVAFSIM
jgi:hypothetical protein